MNFTEQLKRAEALANLGSLVMVPEPEGTIKKILVPRYVSSGFFTELQENLTGGSPLGFAQPSGRSWFNESWADDGVIRQEYQNVKPEPDRTPVTLPADDRFKFHGIELKSYDKQDVISFPVNVEFGPVSHSMKPRYGVINEVRTDDDIRGWYTATLTIVVRSGFTEIVYLGDHRKHIIDKEIAEIRAEGADYRPRQQRGSWEDFINPPINAIDVTATEPKKKLEDRGGAPKGLSPKLIEGLIAETDKYMQPKSYKQVLSVDNEDRYGPDHPD